MEKFLVIEGASYLLKRPGHKDIYFEVPTRPRKEEVLRKFDSEVVTFDRFD